MSDVIVIGGGPAGSTVAALVAESGRGVQIFERTQFPRFAIGESLMPDTYWTFKRLGVLDKLEQSAFPRKHSVQFFGPSGRGSAPFYFSEFAHEVLELGSRLELIDGEARINKHVSVALLGGHSPGSQVVLVDTDAGRVISSRWQEHYPLEKAPGTFRVVAFGGSTTENRVGEMHYPLRLQEMLRERLGRDDLHRVRVALDAARLDVARGEHRVVPVVLLVPVAVSYTHLTLPTILLV